MNSVIKELSELHTELSREHGVLAARYRQANEGKLTALELAHVAVQATRRINDMLKRIQDIHAVHRRRDDERQG